MVRLHLKIEKSGDLIYWTYFMIDWSRVKQGASDQTCTNCGGPMKSVEMVVDGKGLHYGGVVCHTCKSLVWLKMD